MRLKLRSDQEENEALLGYFGIGYTGKQHRSYVHFSSERGLDGSSLFWEAVKLDLGNPYAGLKPNEKGLYEVSYQRTGFKFQDRSGLDDKKNQTVRNFKMTQRECELKIKDPVYDEGHTRLLGKVHQYAWDSFYKKRGRLERMAREEVFNRRLHILHRVTGVKLRLDTFMWYSHTPLEQQENKTLFGSGDDGLYYFETNQEVTLVCPKKSGDERFPLLDAFEDKTSLFNLRPQGPQ